MKGFSVFEATQQWCRKGGLQVQAFESVGSTNDEAKKEALSQEASSQEAADSQAVGSRAVGSRVAGSRALGFPLGAQLYLARHQSQGRGRGANAWVSPAPDEALFITCACELNFAPQHITGPVVGVALYNSVCCVWPELEWSLKAPNDLYLNNLKVAGFLIEAVSKGSRSWLAVGLGFNVFGAPQSIEQAGYLAQSLKNLKVEQWQCFLDELWGQLETAFQRMACNALDAGAQQNLLQALNKNPMQKVPLTQVTDRGDLVGPAGTQLWSEL